MSILAVGPYYGDIEYELLHFNPWVKWLQTCLRPTKTYVMTHFNRHFLYSDAIMLPVDYTLTRNELKQKMVLHGDLSNIQFNKNVKEFKWLVANENGLKLKDINHYNLNYNSSRYQVSYYNKIFNLVDFEYELPETLKDRVVLIPEKRITESCMIEIYNTISKFEEPLVVGDLKCYLEDKNMALRYTSYFQDIYKLIIKCIIHAKVVFCSGHQWAVISNILRKNVFIWSNTPSYFKTDGLYHYNNISAMCIVFDKKTPIKFITKSIEYYMGGLKR